MMKLIEKIKNSGMMLFLKELMSNPSAVGAAFPSTTHLANAIAKLVPKNMNGYIIELGGGTGVVTKALLKQGFHKDKIIVIERSKSLTEHLQKRFPGVDIINGDAQDIETLLSGKINQISAIVSSLPLRSLPDDVVKNIGQALVATLQPEVPFIQFTYSPRKTYSNLPNGLKRQSSKLVLFNLPPARIDIFHNEP